MPTILIADDDPKIVEMLRRTLSYEGYSVLTAVDGREALDQAQAHHPDVVVLDWMMPGLDGIEVARRLRAAEGIPVLMLTARDAVEDRVRGLDSGADDYLVKPFQEEELVARLRALLRRSDRPLRDTLQAGPVEIDNTARQATCGGRALTLGATEFRMLEFFVRNAGMALTRDQLLERLWDYEFDGSSNIVDVYVSQLRRKLRSAGASDVIQTVWGVGYKFQA